MALDKEKVRLYLQYTEEIENVQKLLKCSSYYGEYINPDTERKEVVWSFAALNMEMRKFMEIYLKNLRIKLEEL